MRQYIVPALLALVAVIFLAVGAVKQRERDTGTFAAYGEPPDLTVAGMPLAWPWFVAGLVLFIGSVVALRRQSQR